MIASPVPQTLSRVISSTRRGTSAQSESASGDTSARFRAIVLTHLNDAYALARWLTGNGSDAEDVVQDACVRAFRGIDTFRNGNARAWVLTIVRHAAYEWLAKHRPSALVQVDDLEAIDRERPDGSVNETPETILIAKDGSLRLEAAIGALPAVLRETLVLRTIHGLSYGEIARVTGVAMGTVMSRLARARRKLVAASFVDMRQTPLR